MKVLSAFLFLFIFFSGNYGQELISTSGNFNVGVNGSMSWSIGEPITQTIGGNGHYLTQGYQQPLPSPDPVPTIDQWGMIISLLLLIILGNVAIENQQEKVCSDSFKME